MLLKQNIESTKTRMTQNSIIFNSKITSMVKVCNFRIYWNARWNVKIYDLLWPNRQRINTRLNWYQALKSMFALQNNNLNNVEETIVCFQHILFWCIGYSRNQLLSNFNFENMNFLRHSNLYFECWNKDLKRTFIRLSIRN